MSWWGAHPKLSKADGRLIAGPRACRECVYFARCFSDMTRYCLRCNGTNLKRMTVGYRIRGVKVDRVTIVL